MNDYKQVLKNVTPVARTLSEANRDADYATPIWVCESENVSAMRTMGFVVGMGAIFMLMGIAFVAFLTWLGIVVW
jgi:hypothetical protein